MKTIHTYLAEPVGDQVVEPLTIVVDREQPAVDQPKVGAAYAEDRRYFYRREATALVVALERVLPQGLMDALLGVLHQRSASIYRIPLVVLESKPDSVPRRWVPGVNDPRDGTRALLWITVPRVDGEMSPGQYLALDFLERHTGAWVEGTFRKDEAGGLWSMNGGRLEVRANKVKLDLSTTDQPASRTHTRAGIDPQIWMLEAPPEP